MERNFTEMVRSSQGHWGQQVNHTQLSQAVDLPHSLSSRIYEFALDNLPDYIPPETKQALRMTHPVPIIGLSILVDPRIGTRHEGSINFAGFDSKDLETTLHRVNGLKILGEIAADNLVRDILSKASRTMIQHQTPLSRIRRRAIQALLSVSQEAGTTVQSILISALAQRTIGDEHEFNQQLAVAYITKDTRAIDLLIKQMGARATRVEMSNIYDLATILSRQIGFRYGVENPMGNQDIAAFITAPREPSLGARVRESSSMNGLVTAANPGVINIILLGKMWDSFFLLTGVGAVGLTAASDLFRNPLASLLALGGGSLLSYTSLRSSVRLITYTIHEIAHYLSMDGKSVGLIR